MKTKTFWSMAVRISLLTISCIAPAAADNYPRQLGIDAQHYIFRVTLSDDRDEIAGETTIDLRFVKDGITELMLDLASVRNGKGMTVSDVTMDGQSIRYAHQSDHIAITLPAPPKAGERRQFTVRYSGLPADGFHIEQNHYGERTFYSSNWPDLARQWLPMIDHPYDKATSEFIVTAPSKYQVVANGLLQEQTDLGDGRRVTHWKQSVPISSWLNNIEAARFTSLHFGTADGIPLQLWVYPQDRDSGIVAFEELSRQAIEFFSDHIGPYPYEKLAYVEEPGKVDAVEHASEIYVTEDLVRELHARLVRKTGLHDTLGPAPKSSGIITTWATLVSHETAHQWFGDSVTEKDWDDVWLSEGFATYFAHLNVEHYEGHDVFVAEMKQARDIVFMLEKNNPGLAVIHDNLSDMKKLLNHIIYGKGGWTLHMLRGQIGDDKFWAGIRDYYRRYRDSNASTDDFRRVMEENSGADLRWFLHQWLNRAGSPVIEGGWRYNPEAKKVEIDLSQTQMGDAYRLPLEVGISLDGTLQMRVQKFEMNQKQQRFEIPTEKEPSSVVLDPNTWVLMDAHFEKR